MESRRRYPLEQRADGLWVLPDPVMCPAGHVLDEVGCRRGWVPCLDCGEGQRAKGHLTWTCAGDHGDGSPRVVYDPPHDPAR